MATSFALSARISRPSIAKMQNGDVDFEKLEDNAVITWKDIESQVHREMGDLNKYVSRKDLGNFNVSTPKIQQHQFFLLCLSGLEVQGLESIKGSEQGMYLVNAIIRNAYSYGKRAGA